MMTFFLHDIIEPFDPHQSAGSGNPPKSRNERSSIYTIPEKLAAPAPENRSPRLRVTRAIERSLNQYPATLICGRAGTGKSGVAADFASAVDAAVSWYSVDAADCDWDTFAHYFSACLSSLASGKQKTRKRRTPSTASGDEAIGAFVAEKLDILNADPNGKLRIIVLDDFHNLYDAPWFDTFFVPLLTSLSGDVKLLLLSRAKPPGPIWRLRSKQVLNVIDEKLLAFTPREAADLYRSAGLSSQMAAAAHAETFGRASKIREHLRSDLIRSVTSQR